MIKILNESNKIINKRRINESEEHDDIFTVRFDLAKVVDKSDKLWEPHILIPYSVRNNDISYHPEIIIRLSGNTEFKWGLVYRGIYKLLDEFSVNEKYNNSNEIPKSDFVQAASGSAWSFTGKSDKVIRKILTAEIAKVFKGYKVEFTGELTSKLASILAGKVANYLKMK